MPPVQQPQPLGQGQLSPQLHCAPQQQPRSAAGAVLAALAQPQLGMGRVLQQASFEVSVVFGVMSDSPEVSGPYVPVIRADGRPRAALHCAFGAAVRLAAPDAMRPEA